MCSDPSLHKWTEERESEHLHFFCRNVRRRRREGKRGSLIQLIEIGAPVVMVVVVKKVEIIVVLGRMIGQLLPQCV